MQNSNLQQVDITMSYDQPSLTNPLKRTLTSLEVNQHCPEKHCIF